MSEQVNNAEFLEKFGYRNYEGEREGIGKRIWSLIVFELKSTWHKSTFGKVLLIIILVANGISLLVIASFGGIFGQLTDEMIRNNLKLYVASYMQFLGTSIQPSSSDGAFSPGPNLGILLLALFAIAGSGFFADDKEGKVIEIYLSRVEKRQYMFGKIGGILVYTNLFLMLPLLANVILNIQYYGTGHLDYLGLYIRIIVYSILLSLILGLGILTLSILVEKRNYASLGFFLIYLLLSIFGELIFSLDTSNEFLLLISPEKFLTLLAYVVLGDMTLGIGRFTFEGLQLEPLVLNNGTGLEALHVIGVAFLYIFLFLGIISYKMRKMTTEEL